MSILIADSGSTKTDWAFVNERDEATFFRTQGLNPYFTSEENFISVLSKDVIPKTGITGKCILFFYGAGCGDPSNGRRIEEYFRSYSFKSISIGSDLLGAARATLRHEKGIACILGTGANAGCYDGKDIVKTSPSLGFVLGDEGGGAWLGKQLVTAYIRNELPADLHEQFDQAFHTSRNEILKHIYTQPYPAAYLAQFAGFLDTHRTSPWANALLAEGFSLFFWKSVSALEPSGGVLLGFTGAVSVSFAGIIKEVAETFGFPDLLLEPSPVKGLVKYHTQ